MFGSTTAKDRYTSEEVRARDRAHDGLYHEVRIAAEAHRQVVKSDLEFNVYLCVDKRV